MLVQKRFGIHVRDARLSIKNVGLHKAMGLFSARSPQSMRFPLLHLHTDNEHQQRALAPPKTKNKAKEPQPHRIAIPQKPSSLTDSLVHKILIRDPPRSLSSPSIHARPAPFTPPISCRPLRCIHMYVRVTRTESLRYSIHSASPIMHCILHVPLSKRRYSVYIN